jgi:hypothetical protein
MQLAYVLSHYVGETCNLMLFSQSTTRWISRSTSKTFSEAKKLS